MKQLIILSAFSLLSLVGYSQKKNTTKAVQKDSTQTVKKDSLKVPSDSVSLGTPILSYQDLIDFDKFVDDKLEVHNKLVVVRYDIISQWLVERWAIKRWAIKSREYNSKPKKIIQ